MTMINRFKILYSMVIFIIASVFFSGVMNAQYFGRNKVQYENFKFKIMKTEHFDIYYYPEEEAGVRVAARMAERWYGRFSTMLNHELKDRQPLIIYSSSPHFQQTTAISGDLGEGTGGVTEMFKRRIVLPFGASLAETDHVIGHELVHAFQYDITSQGSARSTGTSSTMTTLPLWLIEGMAEYLSIGSVDPHTAMWMRDAFQKDDLPTIEKLNNPRYFPYRYGQSLWAYITGKWGDGVVATIMKTASRTGNYQEAMTRVLNVSTEALTEEWHQSLKAAYDPLKEKTSGPEVSGNILFKGTKENPLNIAPSISPDGKNIVFLSTQDLFAINMFVADVVTGKIE